MPSCIDMQDGGPTILKSYLQKYNVFPDLLLRLILAEFFNFFFNECDEITRFLVYFICLFLGGKASGIITQLVSLLGSVISSHSLKKKLKNSAKIRRNKRS